MIAIAPGLCYWLAPHASWEPGENWPQHVPCFRFESRDGTILIDPLLPPGEEDMFDANPPASIVLTAPCHARDTALLVERYGVPVWAPPTARWKGDVLTTTDELPAGIEALCPDGDQDQAFLLLREQRALITGDLLSGTTGRLRVFVDEQEREPFLSWLPKLLDLDVDLVLVAHGDLILEDGAARIRDAVAEASPSQE